MSTSSAPPPVPTSVHDVAVHLDSVVAFAVRYGTGSAAWQQAAERFLERVDAAIAEAGEVTTHIGPGHVVEAGTRDANGDLHTHAWHDVWRDGVRSLRWSAPTERASSIAVLRALCAPADAYCTRALQGGDIAGLRVWEGADRDEDVVTGMLRARGRHPNPELRTIDPNVPAGGPLRESFAQWSTLPRPEAVRGIVDAVAAGVEAPRRPGIPGRDAGSMKTWRRTAATLQTQVTARLVAVLEERTKEGLDGPETLAREWLAVTDAALALAEAAPETAWEALGRAIDAQGRLAASHPEVVRLFRAGLVEAQRARALAERLAIAPPSRSWEAARWLVSSPLPVIEGVSRALAATHAPERAEALEQACVRERGDGVTFSAGHLYLAHMSAPAPIASWAITRLTDHHAGELATRDALRAALTHPDPQVQHLALVGLGGDRSDRTRDALDRALRAPRREIVAHALEELLQLKDDGARAVVLARVQAPDFPDLPAAARMMFLDAAARLEGNGAADWMGSLLAQRGWFLGREVKERQAEVRQVLTSLATPWARAVLARGEKP